MTEPHDSFDPDAVATSFPLDSKEAAFAALYEREFLPMVRLATLLCGSTDTARDLVQDAFVKVHRSWRRVREPGAYLRTCVVNGCRSHGRWERRRRGRPVREEPTTEDAYRELDDALLALPMRQRAAIVLRYYEGRTEAEIARILDCRPGTVGPLIHRGLTRLRQQLEPDEEQR